MKKECLLYNFTKFQLLLVATLQVTAICLKTTLLIFMLHCHLPFFNFSFFNFPFFVKLIARWPVWDGSSHFHNFILGSLYHSVFATGSWHTSTLFHSRSFSPACTQSTLHLSHSLTHTLSFTLSLSFFMPLVHPILFLTHHQPSICGDRKITGDEMPVTAHHLNWFGLGGK